MRAGHSTPSGGCEAVLGDTVCHQPSTKFSEAEFYKDGIGPVGFLQEMEILSSSQRSRVRRTVQIIATSLAPADGSTIRPWPWRELSPMAASRERHAAAAFDNRIYVFGGSGSSPGVETSVEIYDPATNAWTAGAAAPVALTSTVARTVGSKIYVILPSAGSSTQIYDPMTDTWAMGAPHPGYDDQSHDGDVMTVTVGGATSEAIVLATPDQHILAINEIHLYRPNSNDWILGASDLASIRGPRWLAATAVGRDLYAIGGSVPTYFLFEPPYVSPEIRRYNVDSNTWTSNVARLRVARHSAKAVTLNGEPVVLGGANALDSERRVREVEACNPETGLCRDLPPMIRQRMNFAAVSLNGKVYVMGGKDGSTTLNQLEMYVPQ